MSPAAGGTPPHEERAGGPARRGLPNGLTVIVSQHDAAPVAAVQLWLRVGARDEEEGEAGLAHFIEHLLFKGTPTRGPGVIDETVASLGGEINAATSQDFTYYHVVLPATHLDTAIDIVADVAMHAVLEPAEVERERLVVLEEIRRAEDNPSAALWRVIARRHFGDHPYGRPVLGTRESILGATREALLAFYGRHYRPAGATVVLAGDVEPERALAQVQRAFAPWEPGRGARPIIRPAVTEGAGRTEERRPLQQTYLGMVWGGPRVGQAPETDVYAVELLASILGRGRSSRLHQALRERLELVSSVNASFYTQRDAGTVLVTARTTPEKQRAAEGAVLDELERVRTAGVGEDERIRALTAVEAAHAFGYETAEGMAYAYGVAETVWTLEFELSYLDAIRRVTCEGIQEAARRHLASDRVTVATLGPEDGAP